MHSDGANFKCKECTNTNVAFRNYRLLRIHILKVHKGIRFICDICGKEFTQPDILNKHKNKIHGIYKKKNKQIDGKYVKSTKIATQYSTGQLPTDINKTVI